MSRLATILGKILVPETPVKEKKRGLSSLLAPATDWLTVARRVSCLCSIYCDDEQAMRVLKPCLLITLSELWG